jgi:hypothetical protein
VDKQRLWRFNLVLQVFFYSLMRTGKFFRKELSKENAMIAVTIFERGSFLIELPFAKKLDLHFVSMHSSSSHIMDMLEIHKV